jgi:UDP-N-acetylmuramyl pentapeptide phosphotransferase/UDP-N-acetylglucosamine-1-phosphate transferase
MNILRFLLLNGFGLGWPALPRWHVALRALVWMAALVVVTALGALAAPDLGWWLALSCAAVIMWLPSLWLSAVRLGIRRPNYLGRNVPAAAGLLFPLVGVPFILSGGAGHSLRFGGCVVVVTMMLVGLGDDLWAGCRQASGLRGHFGALAHGRVTTGAVKAVGGLAAGLVAGRLLHPGDHVRIVLDALLIALSANLINLLDLRPGRALKAFGVLCGLAVSLAPQSLFLLGPAMAASVVSAPSDLAGRTMMGDTGSNVLGGVAGVALASVLSLTGCAIVVVLFVAIHVLCERASLTDVISRGRALRLLDQLGTTHLPPLAAKEAGAP